MNEKKVSEDIEKLLDDDDLRRYFQSRDPNRPKTNPFLDPEVEENISGKASTLIIKEEEAKPKEKVYGISYTQHSKHIRNVSRHFFLIGSASALVLAIILVTLF